MTAQKDFKRVVRARMHKTGESYTAARARLLTKPLARSSTPAAPPAPPAPPTPFAPPARDYAKLAGLSDAAVKQATGCNWDAWVKALDYAKADTWSHRALAEHVREKYKTPDWWSQMVVVGYERIKGLRAIGQRRDGGFEASRSKTVPVPVSRLFRAFGDKRLRAKWLGQPDLTVRKATRDRSMRITWPDGASVEVWFVSKGAGKSLVQVQHTGLPDRAAVDRLKRYWGERLTALADLLAG